MPRYQGGIERERGEDMTAKKLRQAVAIARIQELTTRRAQCVEIERQLSLIISGLRLEALNIDKLIEAEKENAK
jgi:hypothetical protein